MKAEPTLTAEATGNATDAHAGKASGYMIAEGDAELGQGAEGAPQETAARLFNALGSGLERSQETRREVSRLDKPQIESPCLNEPQIERPCLERPRQEQPRLEQLRLESPCLGHSEGVARPELMRMLRAPIARLVLSAPRVGAVKAIGKHEARAFERAEVVAAGESTPGRSGPFAQGNGGRDALGAVSNGSVVATEDGGSGTPGNGSGVATEDSGSGTPVNSRCGVRYQATLYAKDKAFHINFAGAGGLAGFLNEWFGPIFTRLNAWDAECEHSARVTKSGKTLATVRPDPAGAATAARASASAGGGQSGFDRAKRRALPADADAALSAAQACSAIPVLVDMGVYTKAGRVVAGMQGKYRQINRYLELLADGVDAAGASPGQALNMVDFGCGKSYLTFLSYHYFERVRGFSLSMAGVDLKEDVVRSCNEAARRYGYRSLRFCAGDAGRLSGPPVAEWGSPGSINAVMCLHACDTATDSALFMALSWGADLVYAAPCCQHELNAGMSLCELNVLESHGAIKERVAALATDAIRAALLAYAGYKVQVAEFVDLGHTPKNLLIRARRVRAPGSGPAAAEARMHVEEAERVFSFAPALLRLMRAAGRFPSRDS